MNEIVTNRKKQIEEMAKISCGLCEYEHCGECLNDNDCEIGNCYMAKHTAERLYNTGYRKQSENTVELPCKVGDTVYRLKKRRGVWCILPREVVSITYRLDHLNRVEWEIFSTETDTLGKTVFLTEAEAEEALAKVKGGAE